jgi:hypothetical protein
MSDRALERVTSGVTATLSGTVTANQTPSTTTTVVAVPFDDIAPGVTLLAANPLRLGAAIYNNSDGDLFIKLGTAVVATTALFTVKVIPGFYYEVPYNFTGVITGIWAAAATSGDAQVTEFLP